MNEIKQKVIKTDKEQVVIEVEADTIEEFLNYQVEERIKRLDDVGPFAPNQAMPFITHKQNIPIYIALAICLIAHIWARVTIGL